MASGIRLTVAKTARFSVFQHHGTASRASKDNERRKQTRNPTKNRAVVPLVKNNKDNNNSSDMEEMESLKTSSPPPPPPCFPPTERAYMLDTYLMAYGESYASVAGLIPLKMTMIIISYDTGYTRNPLTRCLGFGCAAFPTLLFRAVLSAVAIPHYYR